MELLDLKIVDLSPDQWGRGHLLAKQFLKEHPEKFGWRNGCVYSNRIGTCPDLYVYRTRTQIVVRKIGGSNG